jgi:hypothetical protein
MLFVTATTMTAAVEMVTKRFPAMIEDGKVLSGGLSMAMTIFVIACVAALMLVSMARWAAVLRGIVPIRREDAGLMFDHRLSGTPAIAGAGLLPSGRSEAIKPDGGAVTDRPS